MVALVQFMATCIGVALGLIWVPYFGEEISLSPWLPMLAAAVGLFGCWPKGAQCLFLWLARGRPWEAVTSEFNRTDWPDINWFGFPVTSLLSGFVAAGAGKQIWYAF